GGGPEGVAAGRRVYYRGQALAGVRDAAVRAQPDVRRGYELSEWAPARGGSETHRWPECIYPQQAPDIQPTRASGSRRGARVDAEGGQPGRRTLGAAGPRRGGGVARVLGDRSGPRES